MCSGSCSCRCRAVLFLLLEPVVVLVVPAVVPVVLLMLLVLPVLVALLVLLVLSLSSSCCCFPCCCFSCSCSSCSRAPRAPRAPRALRENHATGGPHEQNSCSPADRVGPICGLVKSGERISESAQKTPHPAPHARRERRAGSEVRGPIPSAAGTRAGLKLMGPISQ